MAAETLSWFRPADCRGPGSCRLCVTRLRCSSQWLRRILWRRVPLAAPPHADNVPARQRLSSARGSAMIELALILSVSLPMLLGVTGIGIRLGRSLEGLQLTRDVAHMYAMGTDFSLSGTQAIARTLSRDFSLTSTGNGVLILSRVVKVFQADCTAAGLPNCPNLNQPA